MNKKAHTAFLSLIALAVFFASAWGSPEVLRVGDKTYIVDRYGERWDVTQAKSIGFKPERFQYGIGRNAFTPLDDSQLTDDTKWVYGGLRVIGVMDGAEAKAYSVPKLRHHEIANSLLGTQHVAVAY